MRNTFGHIFTLTSFGESHGEAVGGVVDGMPAGIDIDDAFIQHELDRRRPGQSRITTARKEPDRVTLLSGVMEGKTTGCPIGFIVGNTNQHCTLPTTTICETSSVLPTPTIPIIRNTASAIIAVAAGHRPALR